MRALAYIAGMLALACIQGCAVTNPPEVKIQPVTITGDSFCRIVKERLSWHPRDTRPTIDGIRQFNAKWVSRCGQPKPVG